VRIWTVGIDKPTTIETVVRYSLRDGALVLECADGEEFGFPLVNVNEYRATPK
jgi:coenzyme F420-reducing hydrogenase beta subunit